MPYVKQEARERLDHHLLRVASRIYGPGDLNYAITRLCLERLPTNGAASYADYNELIGVLECVKQELYRRAVVPYETEKASQNGDVY